MVLEATAEVEEVATMEEVATVVVTVIMVVAMVATRSMVATVEVTVTAVGEVAIVEELTKVMELPEADMLQEVVILPEALILPEVVSEEEVATEEVMMEAIDPEAPGVEMEVKSLWEGLMGLIVQMEIQMVVMIIENQENLLVKRVSMKEEGFRDLLPDPLEGIDRGLLRDTKRVRSDY